MDVLSFLYQALASLVVAAVFAFVVRRLLPAVSWIRAFAVSLLVIVALIPGSVWIGTALGIFNDDGGLMVGPGTALLAAGLIVLWMFALALGALVLLELFIPTGALGGPIRGLRESCLGARRIRRYLQLAWIVMSSGLGRSLRYGPESTQFVEALMRTINQAGVTFVKFGQIMATRSDTLPRPLIKALSTLQTSAEPADPEAIHELLVHEWGASPDEVLSSFDPQPFAAASVAQVHRGILDGAPVAIKVQRPGAADQVRVDCDILMRFAAKAEKRFEWARALGLASLISGLAGSLNEELNYEVEARNTLAVQRTLAPHPLIATPRIVSELSTARVLVMSELKGTNVAQALPKLSTQERDHLARELFAATAESILIHGVFHADLHPGNIMILDDRRVGLLDFGAIGVIDAETRQLLASLLLALVTDDNVNATTSVIMGFDVDTDINRAALQRDLGRVMTILAHSQRADASIFSEVFSVLRTYGITVPGDVAGAFRTLTALDSTLRLLSPDYGLYEAARDSLPTIVAELSSPKRLAKIAATTALTSAIGARRLPARIEHMTTQLDRGEFTIRARSFANTHDRSWLGSVVDDVLSGVFACIAIIMALVFLLVPGGAPITAVLTAHHLMAAALGFIGITLALRLAIRLFTRRSLGERR